MPVRVVDLQVGDIALYTPRSGAGEYVVDVTAVGAESGMLVYNATVIGDALNGHKVWGYPEQFRRVERCGSCGGTGTVEVQIGGDGYGDRCCALADVPCVCVDCDGRGYFEEGDS